MAELLDVHRQTVVAAYDELIAQGWIESKGAKGTFVSSKIPEMKPVFLDKTGVSKGLKKETGFIFEKKRT
ncbi:MAG: GntR family transcriptional regulator [Saprospiraceae bacterium]|nr:GntR family transcriptional regulator [Saprospiraceae bacterium]